VLLPAKRLLEIISSFPTATTVAIDVKGMRRASRPVARDSMCSDSRLTSFRTASISAADRARAARGEALRRRAVAVAPLVSELESRPILGGILLDAADDGLYLVSTDGHRMAAEGLGRSELPRRVHHPARGSAGNPKSPSRTRRARDSRRRESAPARGEGLDRSQTRLIEGPYPNYRQLLGSKVKVTVIVNAALLVDAVKRVALVSPEKTRSVALMLKENEIRLVTNSPDEGTGAMSSSADTTVTSRQCRRSRSNANYIVNVIDAIGADENGEIALQLTGAERAIYVRHAEDADVADARHRYAAAAARRHHRDED
jgi:DNA polymerase-3 subunit beta